jgi:hypothetical protein
MLSQLLNSEQHQSNRQQPLPQTAALIANVLIASTQRGMNFEKKIHSGSYSQRRTANLLNSKARSGPSILSRAGGPLVSIEFQPVEIKIGNLFYLNRSVV